MLASGPSQLVASFFEAWREGDVRGEWVRLMCRYVVTLVAMFNVGDLLGRYIPLIECLLLKSRPMLVAAAVSRIAFIPAFYFTAKYGPQGWMIILTLVLGITNGYVCLCAFIGAPKGYLVRNSFNLQVSIPALLIAGHPTDLS